MKGPRAKPPDTCPGEEARKEAERERIRTEATARAEAEAKLRPQESTATRTKGRGKVRRSGDDSEGDPDDPDLDFTIPDPIAHVMAQPIVPNRAARIAASGSMAWISDPQTVPSVDPKSTSVSDPNSASLNVSIFDEIVVVRELAILLNEVEDDPSLLRGDLKLVTMGDLFEGASSAGPTPRSRMLSDAFVRAARAVGRRAKGLREMLKKERQSTTQLKVVPDARAPGGLSDIATYVRRERIEDLVTEIDQVAQAENDGLLSVADGAADPDFVIGIALARCAFDSEQSARGLWRAVATMDRNLAASVRKEYAAEIKEAKEDARDERTARIAAASAAARGAASGGGGGAAPTGGGASRRQLLRPRASAVVRVLLSVERSAPPPRQPPRPPEGTEGPVLRAATPPRC